MVPPFIKTDDSLENQSSVKSVDSHKTVNFGASKSQQVSNKQVSKFIYRILEALVLTVVVVLLLGLYMIPTVTFISPLLPTFQPVYIHVPHTYSFALLRPVAFPCVSSLEHIRVGFALRTS